MKDDTDCMCKYWARDGLPPITEHHKKCDKYNPVIEAMDLINSLITGIEEWGNEEDGIYDKVYESYKKAKLFIGTKLNEINKH